MLFFRRPFVLITLVYLLGLILGFSYRNHAVVMAFCAWSVLFVALSSHVFRVKGLNFLVLSCLSFCALGTLSMLECLHSWGPNGFERRYAPGAICVLRISESKMGKGDWNKAIGEVQQVIGKRTFTLSSERLLLLIHKEVNLPKVGARIALSSRCLKIRNDGNPGEFDAEMFWSRQGVNYMAFVSKGELDLLDQKDPSLISKWLSASRNFLKSCLTSQLSGPELAITLALVLGDNSMLDKEIRNSFTNTGALHVLAVSGLHISIIMQILMAVLAMFAGLLSRRIAVILLIGIMWWYAAITGLSPSVLRAVIMFTVLSIAQLSGKSYDSLNALMFTAFLLVLWNPLSVFDIGFQLSFLAMLGIFLFYEKIERFWAIKQPLLRKVWQGTAIGLAAQLMTTPLSLYYFNQFPNYFMLTNIGLMASSGLILGGGLLLFSVSWWAFIAKWVGFALMLVVGVSLWFIQWVESLPGAVAYGYTPNFGTVLAFGILLPLIFYVKFGSKLFWVTLVLGFSLFVGIVFQRFQNMNKNEIVVFNAKMTVISVRIHGHVFCFYRSRKKDIEKVKQLLLNYTKLHPGQLHYYNLERRNWDIAMGKERICIERNREGVRLNFGRHVVRVCYKDRDGKRKLGEHSIAMPWLEVRLNSPFEHYLGKGAWRLAI